MFPDVGPALWPEEQIDGLLFVEEEEDAILEQALLPKEEENLAHARYILAPNQRCKGAKNNS